MRAAARLAALYVGAVLVLAIVTASVMDGVSATLGSLIMLWMPVSVAFLIAFMLLAAARRTGFTVLWLVLLAIWVLMLRQSHGVWIGTQFLGWSLLALPLYALGVVGAPSSRRVVRSISLMLTIVWITLLIGVFVLARVQIGVEPPSAALEWVLRNEAVWGTLPFIVSVSEVVRLWVATGQISAAAA